MCAPAARDADKTAIEICYIYLQPSLLPTCWHDWEPETLQALAGLCHIWSRGAEEPVLAGSGSRSRGVGHEYQNIGFRCLMSQQGHCSRGPAPDPREGLGVGWHFLAHLPSSASLGGTWQHTLSRIGRERSQLWVPRGLRPPCRGQPVLLGQLLQAHWLKLQPGGIKGGHSGKFLHVGG